MILQILTYTHHTTTLLFGIFLSAFFLGVKQDKKNVMKLLLPAAGSGILYVLISYGFGAVIANRFYPLIVHLPLWCVLVLYYKFRPLPSLISIFTAYLCCHRTGMVLLCLSYSGDGGNLYPSLPLCLPDDDYAVRQDRSGVVDHRKPAGDILYF